jgi:hypothetical protein
VTKSTRTRELDQALAAVFLCSTVVCLALLAAVAVLALSPVVVVGLGGYLLAWLLYRLLVPTGMESREARAALDVASAAYADLGWCWNTLNAACERHNRWMHPSNDNAINALIYGLWWKPTPVPAMAVAGNSDHSDSIPEPTYAEAQEQESAALLSDLLRQTTSWTKTTADMVAQPDGTIKAENVTVEENVTIGEQHDTEEAPDFPLDEPIPFRPGDMPEDPDLPGWDDVVPYVLPPVVVPDMADTLGIGNGPADAFVVDDLDPDTLPLPASTIDADESGQAGQPDALSEPPRAVVANPDATAPTSLTVAERVSYPPAPVAKPKGKRRPAKPATPKVKETVDPVLDKALHLLAEGKTKRETARLLGVAESSLRGKLNRWNKRQQTTAA